MFRKFSVKMKSTISVIIICVLLIYFFVVYTTYSALLHENNAEKVTQIAERITTNVHLRMNTIQNIAQMWTQKEQFKNSINTDRIYIFNAIREMLTVNSGIETFFFFDEENTYFYNTSEATVFSDLAEKARENKKTQSYWMLYRHSKTGSNYLMYLHRLTDAQGEFSGFLALSIATEYLGDIFIDYRNSFVDNSFAIINSNIGTYICVKGNLQNGEVESFLSETKYSDAQYNYIKDNYYVSVQPLKGKNLSLQIFTPLNQISRNLQIFVIVLVLIFMAAVFMALWIPHRYVNCLVEHFNELTEKMQRFSGNREV